MSVYTHSVLLILSHKEYRKWQRTSDEDSCTFFFGNTFLSSSFLVALTNSCLYGAAFSSLSFLLFFSSATSCYNFMLKSVKFHNLLNIPPNIEKGIMVDDLLIAFLMKLMNWSSLRLTTRRDIKKMLKQRYGLVTFGISSINY